MAIEQILGALEQIAPKTGATLAKPTSGFGESLKHMVEASEESNREANEAVSAMIDGRGDVHDAMIALQRADLTLQFTVQVKNKLVQAYQDIMRTPV
ncbi:MAG: flagellar hook-basal body complex protein FliE [Vicinamibacterales bacterium]